jgi:hypothetical protein
MTGVVVERVGADLDEVVTEVPHEHWELFPGG